MKAVQIQSFGQPVRSRPVRRPRPSPAAPAADQALVALEASPINPSDVLTLSAQYGLLPKLPAVPGNEGLGRVLEVGNDVKNVRSRATSSCCRPAWERGREKLLVPAARLFPCRQSRSSATRRC